MNIVSVSIRVKVVLKNVITDANINLTTQEVTNTTNKQDVVMAYVENNEIQILIYIVPSFLNKL